MKKIVLLSFLLFGFTVFGQEKKIKKPEYVVIVNNEIVSEEKIAEYVKEGSLKSINKGVSEAERNRLAELFGDRIGDKEFIVKIELLTSEEKAERQKQSSSDIKQANREEKPKNQLKLNVNDPAADFTVEMIDGKSITLSALKGKVVLVNYWATWCAPCLMEFAEFPEKILDRFKGKDFVFIPISIGESKEEVEKKMMEMKKYGVNFNVGIDPGKKIWDEYATGAIPKSFVIDQNGTIKYVSIGNADGSVNRLAAEIGNLLAN